MKIKSSKKHIVAQTFSKKEVATEFGSPKSYTRNMEGVLDKKGIMRNEIHNTWKKHWSKPN
jgi:hypothetical protein